MMRITFQPERERVTFFLEGRFADSFAEETRRLAARCSDPRQLVADLTQVTFVDAAGEEVLLWLNRLGARFIAGSCYAQHVCEQLQLRLFEHHRRSEGHVKANGNSAEAYDHSC
jgi:hypothetical protein